jgi:hypothetical protein
MKSEENSSFKNRFQILRAANKYTDCSFLIDKQIVNCHKLMLISCSPVFEAQFFGDFRESADSNNIVKITDINIKIFNLLLDFLYLGEFSLGEESEHFNDDVKM